MRFKCINLLCLSATYLYAAQLPPEYERFKDMTEKEQIKYLNKLEKKDLLQETQKLGEEECSNIIDCLKKEEEINTIKEKNNISSNNNINIEIDASFIGEKKKLDKERLLENERIKFGFFSLREINIPEKLENESYIELTNLNDYEMEATAGRHASYSDKFSRELMYEMHQSGHLWELKYHEPIFVHGLLNFYFNYFTGINPEDETYFKTNYLGRFQNKEFIKNILNSKHFFKIYNLLRFVHYQLQHNKTLQLIGSNFQKQKVRVEKLQGLLEDSSKTQEEKDKIISVIYQEDRHLTIIQTVIFNWIKEVINRAGNIIEKSFGIKNPLDYKNNEFVRNLQNLRPQFLDDPYWAQSLKVLKLYNVGNEPTKASLKIDRAYNSYINNLNIPFNETDSQDSKMDKILGSFQNFFYYR